MTDWTVENLHIWEVANWDFSQLSCAERARMLKQFGIRHYAYLASVDPHGIKPDITTSHLDIDAEIEALHHCGISVRACQLWFNGDDPSREPLIGSTLEAFKRHGIAPHIWVTQAFSGDSLNLLNPVSSEGMPQTPYEQNQRVGREADRIAAMVRAAAPYGCKVNLYNHQDWFGLMQNQLAVLDRLKEMGVADVGLVYNLGHSFSRVHDDANGFPDLWERIKPYVTTLNVMIFGTREIDMLRTIDRSGWRGAVGVFSGFGNMKLTIPNALWTLNWALGEARSDNAA